MKVLKLLVLLVMFSGVLIAQNDSTKAWTRGGMFSLNASQVSLTNWSAGGQNNISGNVLTNLFINYQEGNTSWENSLDLGYGLQKQGDASPIKSDDKIDFVSKFGYKASKEWNYSAIVNFKTQFTEGFNYPNDSIAISNFMAPGYLVLTVGMDYKPNKHFSAFISPVTGKTTFVNNQDLANAGAFGVEAAVIDPATGLVATKGKTIRNEFGGYIKLQVKYDIMKNVNLQSKIDLFSNYIDKPENIDVNWEMLLAMKINDYITANINTLLIYDDDIKIEVDENNDGTIDAVGPRIQFKEVFSLGLSVKF